MKKPKVTMNKPVYLGMPVLDISKTNTYELWYDYVKAKYGDEQKYVTQILIALYSKLKLKISLKTLLMMLKDGLIHLTMIKMIKDLFQ